MSSITDDGGSVRILTGTSSVAHPYKDSVSVYTIGDDVVVRWDNVHYFRDNYANITAPSGATAVAVADAIAAFLDTNPAEGVSGSGTANRLAMFTASATIGNSRIGQHVDAVAYSIYFQDRDDTTKVAGFSMSAITTATTRVYTFPDATGTLTVIDAAQTLSNKTLGVSNIVTLRDDRFTLQDDADTTKQAIFQLSAITTGKTRTFTVPNASGTLAVLSAINAWTGKQYFAQATLTDAATISWNLNAQQNASVTLGGNRTMDAPTNHNAGANHILVVIQDAIGSRTLTWNAEYKFPAGVAPILTTAAAAVDVFEFYDNGINLLCINGAFDIK